MITLMSRLDLLLHMAMHRCCMRMMVLFMCCINLKEQLLSEMIYASDSISAGLLNHI